MTHEMLKKGARKRRHYWRTQCRVSPWRTGASAGRRQHSRRYLVELRDQSGARQGAGVPRSLPRAEGGRPARDLGCRQYRAADARAAGRYLLVVRLHCWRRAGRTDQSWLAQAGFVDVRVTPQPKSRELVASWAPGRGIENYVASATVEARKPGGDGASRG